MNISETVAERLPALNKIMHQHFRDFTNYSDLDDYAERASTEIFTDEVWIWRRKKGVIEDFSDLSMDEIIAILAIIMKKIVSKGGVPADYSCDKAEKIINKYTDKKSEALIDELADFILHNPDYGEDGNGIWFE